MIDKKPCPYCGSKFGQMPEFRYGCTNTDCPEQPQYHDPVGVDDEVDEFWAKVHREAVDVIKAKQAYLAGLIERTNAYYSSGDIKEIIQVFDAGNSKMPEDIFTELCVFYFAANGSYHRWYPNDKKAIGMSQETFDKTQEWLLQNGMIVNSDNEYFHVLINLHW